MIKQFTALGALALAATSNLVLAQQGGQQPPARGPEMVLALEAAQTAVSTCIGNGVKGTAAVVDSAGVLRVLLSADGASKNSAESSPKKAFTANALKTATSEVAAKMEKDPAFKAKIEADTTLYPRPGGLPLMAGNDVIGAIGFGGASTLNGVQGGLRDEACAKAGLEKVRARLK
jgi:uncharacterized protein GlcG (DUF336 family)